MHRIHFSAWARVQGNIAFTGDRRGVLLAAVRAWSNAVARSRAVDVAKRRAAKMRDAWMATAVAPYSERIRRLEFQLAQVGTMKQSDSKERAMLHAYLAHSARSNAFALATIRELRGKLT